jgi:hypothetical protein
MGEQLINGIVTVSVAIIGVAILAVLVSRNANTAGVLQSGGQAFSSVLGVAESPVTGSSGNLGFGGLSGPTGGMQLE